MGGISYRYFAIGVWGIWHVFHCWVNVPDTGEAGEEGKSQDAFLQLATNAKLELRLI